MPLQREPAKQGGGFTRFVNQNVEAGGLKSALRYPMMRASIV